FVQYWSMRVMAYLGSLAFLLALWGSWLAHRHKLERSRVFLFVATWAVITPFLMNTAGWLLTENGRQPWIVQGLMLTSDGVSPSVSSTEIWITLIGFLVVYLILGVINVVLMLRYARRDLTDDPEAAAPTNGGDSGDEGEGAEPSERVPALTY